MCVRAVEQLLSERKPDWVTGKTLFPKCLRICISIIFSPIFDNNNYIKQIMVITEFSTFPKAPLPIDMRPVPLFLMHTTKY